MGIYVLNVQCLNKGGKMSKPKYKIRYRDNMTTYLIDMVFNSKEQAEYYIECNLGDSSLYEVETTNHDIETRNGG